MKQVVLNFKGHNPSGSVANYGYSDGNDVGFKYERPRYYYSYGTNNLAFKKKYTTTPAAKNENSIARLTDGYTTAINNSTLIYYGSRWNGNANPSIVLDMDTAKTVGGVRVLEVVDQSTCDFADSIMISVSLDSATFVQQGMIRKVDLWFAPTNIPLPSKWDSKDYRNFRNWGIISFKFDYAFDSPVLARYVKLDVYNSREVSIQEIEIHDSCMTKILVSEELNNGFTIPVITVEHKDDHFNYKHQSLENITVCPNPFTFRTNIIMRNIGYQVSIFDLSGKCVYRVNSNGYKNNSELIWNGTNEKGEELSSGVYFIKSNNPHRILTKKVLLIR
jgi:hypothetical protein